MIPFYRDFSSLILDEAVNEAQSERDSRDTPHLKNICAYCQRKLAVLEEDSDIEGSHVTRAQMFWSAELQVCNTCGWWRIIDDVYGWGPDTYSRFSVQRAILRKLDESGLDRGARELERYLMARPEARFHLNPRRLEEIAHGVFRSLGFDVLLTAYSGDEGIDLIVLGGPSGRFGGVQVKRYKNKIQAEAIRAFSGALFLKGMTKGVFITTSQYTPGAKAAQLKAEQRGQYISLWDGKRFLDVIGCSLRPMYTETSPLAPFYVPWIKRSKWQEPSKLIV